MNHHVNATFHIQFNIQTFLNHIRNIKKMFSHTPWLRKKNQTKWKSFNTNKKKIHSGMPYRESKTQIENFVSAVWTWNILQFLCWEVIRWCCFAKGSEGCLVATSKIHQHILTWHCVISFFLYLVSVFIELYCAIHLNWNELRYIIQP